MRSPRSISILLIIASVLLPSALSQISATISIGNNPDFADQRSCALYCWNDWGVADSVARVLSCTPNDPALNECYCRSDLQSEAISYIASCVSAQCTSTYDVNKAVGFYTSYCATADETQTLSFPAASTTQPSAPATTSTSETSESVHTDATSTSSLGTVVTSTDSGSSVMPPTTVTASNGQVTTHLLISISPTTGMEYNELI